MVNTPDGRKLAEDGTKLAGLDIINPFINREFGRQKCDRSPSGTRPISGEMEAAGMG